MTDPTDPATDSASTAHVSPTSDRGTESRTFLIADVRGYTKYTAEFGDQAAGDLVARFAELVQEVVANREGLLLELRGDEALVVFVSARQALRAAVELQERFEAAGLARGVGIGLDAGEAVPVGDGYRGSALNLAARLCAQAGPGEVIASEAVIHLAARLDGISYVEPRSFRLKGLAEPIRAVGVVASSRVPRGLGRRVRRARQWSAERGLLLVVGAILATAAVVAVTLGGAFTARPSASPAATGNALGGPSGAPSPAGPASGPGIAFIDIASGTVRALNPTLRRPVSGQWVGDRLWVRDADPPAFYRIDPGSGQVERSISTEIDVGDWLVDGNTIWVTDSEEPLLHRIDIPSGRQTGAFRLSPEADGSVTAHEIVKAAGALWVSLSGASGWTLERVDPRTGGLVATIRDVVGPYLGADDQHVWIGAPWGELHEIDPATNAVGPAIGVTGPIAAVLSVGDDAWASNAEAGLVELIGPGHDVPVTRFVEGARSISSADGVVWVGGRESVSSIPVGSGATRTYEIGHSVADVEASAGTIAVLSTTGVDDATAGLTGRIIRIASQGDPFATIDPAVRGGLDSEERWQVDRASCAGLLAYPDAAAPDGAGLVPEVAEAVPTLSADQRTYTFRIRPGFAFSPPSDEPITAETFRSTIERALDPGLGPDADGIDQLADVVGAADYHAGRATSISGLSTSDDTLSITLSAPSSSFLRRLSLPTFCPVPIGSARLHGGVNDPPLPRSGPYYVSDHVAGQYLVLRRNPNYPGQRTPGADAIVWLTEIDPADAISRLEAGSIDLVPSGAQLDPQAAIARKWGAGGTDVGSGGQRYFSSDGGQLGFIAFNPRDPLLKDPTVRRAVALAVSRTDMAQSWSMIATSGLVPSVDTGRASSQPFKLDGVADADALAEAKRLMAGRSGALVISFWTNCDACQRMATGMASDLRMIGLGLTVQIADDPAAAAGKRGSDISMVVGFTGPPEPDPGAILDQVRDAVPQGWLGPADEAAIDDLDRLAEPQRQGAAASLVDRLERVDVPLIAFARGWRAAYVDANLGCELFAPSAPGLDLTSLCTRH